MKKIYNQFKCWVLNIDRYKTIKEITLKTNRVESKIKTVHKYDNWKNIIKIETICGN